MLSLNRVGLILCVIFPLSPIQSCSAQSPNGCTPVNAAKANGYSKIEILRPGNYCLTADLHARVELADRPAEVAMIQIGASNVRLDLQGHTLGRGRLFKNPGGMGIEIGLRVSDVVVTNGILRDFDAAVFVHPGTLSEPTYDQYSDTYIYPGRGIVLERLTFHGNRRNVR